MFNGILVCNQFKRSRRCASMYFYISVLVKVSIRRNHTQHTVDTMRILGELIGTKFKCLQDVGTDPLAHRLTIGIDPCTSSTRYVQICPPRREQYATWLKRTCSKCSTWDCVDFLSHIHIIEQKMNLPSSFRNTYFF